MSGVHNQAKLTEREVLKIDRLLKSGNSVKSIAAEFGIPIGTIYNIKQRRTWRYLLCNQDGTGGAA